MIGLTEGTVEQMAVKCLIYYEVATLPEVISMLATTQSEVDSVGDAALRGLQAMVLALPRSGEVFDNLVVVTEKTVIGASEWLH